MNLRIVCSWLLALALCGTALAQAPIEPPVATPHPSDETQNDEESDSTPLGSLAADQPRLNEFQGDDIGLVLRTLARQAKINLVLSDKASKEGTVTVRIEDRSPKEVIEIIVQCKGLIMDEVNGVYFVKTVEEHAKMPTDQMLMYTTDKLVAPLARLKGEYYKHLVQSGVPESTAATILLNEELSKGAFGGHAGRLPNDPATSRESQPITSNLQEWFAWTAVGSMGLELFNWMPMILLHIIFAISVWATARRAVHSGVTLSFFSPFFWGFSTFIGGVLVAGLYWLIHHSSIGTQGATRS